VLERIRNIGFEELARYPEREPIEAIAAEYLAVRPQELLLTNGVDEAIHLICQTYLDTDDEVLIVVPTFAMYEIFASATGARIIKIPAGKDFSFPTETVLQNITPRTRLIAMANPNNPTGTAGSIEDLLLFARSAPDAAILIDEAYYEFHGETALRRWVDYPNLFVARTFSKAYGLAGLRIGWALASPRTIDDLWRRHEYAVIAASGPSMLLAEMALQPEKRASLLERQRNLSRGGHEFLQEWVHHQEGRFSFKTPASSSIAFVKYNFNVPSVDVAEHLRRRASVLVAPGAYLGAENHLRIAVGYGPEKLRPALARISSAVAELTADTLAPR